MEEKHVNVNNNNNNNNNNNKQAHKITHQNNNASNTTTTTTTQNGLSTHRQVGRPKKHGNAGRKKINKTSQLNNNLTLNNGNIGKTADSALSCQQDVEKQNKVKELLNMIENSYQNIYFNRCKSYKKAKLADMDFKFDFSTFDSHCPYYPTALEDINTKINKTNSFWKSIS